MIDNTVNYAVSGIEKYRFNALGHIITEIV